MPMSEHVKTKEPTRAEIDTGSPTTRVSDASNVELRVVIC